MKQSGYFLSGLAVTMTVSYRLSNRDSNPLAPMVASYLLAYAIPSRLRSVLVICTSDKPDTQHDPVLTVLLCSEELAVSLPDVSLSRSFFFFLMYCISRNIRLEFNFIFFVQGAFGLN